MSKVKIKKSFLFTVSPPFFRRSLAPPNLLNVPKNHYNKHMFFTQLKLQKV